MKDFMLIFKGTNYEDLGLSPEQLQQRLGKWGEWSERLGKEGILKGGDALHGGMRVVEGVDKVVTDRSSAGLKEVIGGYFLISVKDIDAATEIAKDYPDYDTPGGRVDIREVIKYEY